MKLMSLKVGALIASLALLNMTSSCTSGSKSESTQTQNATEFSKDPLENLKLGNKRFVKGESVHPHQDSLRVRELIAGQQPQVVIVSCSDSRATPEIIFDQGLGDIFTIRTAGNVMNDYEEGSIEYAVEHAGAKLVVVMGHTHCGAIHAMKSLSEEEKAPGHINAILETIKEELEQKNIKSLSKDSIEYYATLANVEHGVKQLKNSEPILKEKLDNGDIQIVGGLYNIESGNVEFFDFED